MTEPSQGIWSPCMPHAPHPGSSAATAEALQVASCPSQQSHPELSLTAAQLSDCATSSGAGTPLLPVHLCTASFRSFAIFLSP